MILPLLFDVSFRDSALLMYASNFHKKQIKLSSIEKVYNVFSSHLILEKYDIFR